MLSFIEKILFAIATFISLYLTYRGAMRIADQISSGQGKIDWTLLPKRMADLVAKFIFFQPVFRLRLIPSILHAFIGWGFFTYLLINLSDLIYGYTGFKLLYHLGWFGDVYRAE